MAAPLAALPWLMRGAKAAWPWLMRGKGINLPLRKTAQGVTQRVAAPGSGVPHTLSRQGVKHGMDKAGRPIAKYPSGQDLRYSPLNPRAPFHSTRELPAGYARRHPIVTAGVGATGVGTGYGMMAGDDEPMVAPAQAYAPEVPWSAPPDMLNFADQQELLAAEGKEELSRMLKFGFGLAAAGADPTKFFERGTAIIEQSKAYKESKHYADVVRAVYKDGDMPKNARIAYERLTPLVGPEQAAVLSGHQLGMEEGKTKEERIWNKIMDIAQYDVDGAAAELVAAWGTGMLKNPPVQPQNEIRLAKAREMIAQLMGGTGLAAGIQNLERVDA